MPIERRRGKTVADWQSEEDRKFRGDVASVAASLREMASIGSAIKKWTPWLVAAVGVLYPTVGHFIAQLPALPH